MGNKALRTRIVWSRNLRKLHQHQTPEEIDWECSSCDVPYRAQISSLPDAGSGLLIHFPAVCPRFQCSSTFVETPSNISHPKSQSSRSLRRGTMAGPAYPVLLCDLGPAEAYVGVGSGQGQASFASLINLTFYGRRFARCSNGSQDWRVSIPQRCTSSGMRAWCSTNREREKATKRERQQQLC